MENKDRILIFLIIILSFFIIFFAFKKDDKKVTEKNPSNENEIIKIDKMSFNDNVINLKPESEYHLSMNIIPVDATERIIYSVSDESIISVTDTGKLKALKEGIATIYALTESGISTEVEVVVKKESYVVQENKIEVTNIEITNGDLSLKSGQNIRLTYNLYPSNATDKSVFFETSDARIVSVSDSGIISARTEGSATISIYSNNLISDSIKVTVSPMNISLSQINLTPTNLNIDVNETYKLNVEYIPSNASDKKTVFSSANSSIATVDSNGVVRGISSGTTIITAKCNDKTSSINVTVNKNNNDILISELSINDSDLELKVTEEKKLSVSYKPSNATNSSLSWASSNNKIVTVDNNGLIKAIGVGSANITVSSSNGKKDTIKIIVKENEKVNSPQEIFLNLTSIKLKPNETKQLKATIIPLTASQDVTWVSGSDEVVTVNNSGLLTAKKIGKTTISAITKNGLVAKINVSVGYPDITPETAAEKYGLDREMSSSEIAKINAHLKSYMEEAELTASSKGISEERAKTLAAAYFLTYNPYYRIRYLGNTMDYVVEGWNPIWSTSRGSTRPTGGLDCYSFISWAIYQGTGKLIKVGSSSGRPVRYSTDGNMPAYQIAALGEPGDVLVRTNGSSHYAMLYSINEDSITIIHSAGSSDSLCTTTYPLNTTVKFNILYSMDNTYKD